MARGMVSSRKPPGSHQWVFRWRPLKQPLLPKLFGLALVGAAFVFLVTSVRIRVTALEKSTPRKASVIYLRDDAQGRALTLRAQEGGPFPSRFALSQWDGMAMLEAAAIEVTSASPEITASQSQPQSIRSRPSTNTCTKSGVITLVLTLPWWRRPMRSTCLSVRAS